MLWSALPTFIAFSSVIDTAEELVNPHPNQDVLLIIYPSLFLLQEETTNFVKAQTAE